MKRLISTQALEKILIIRLSSIGDILLTTPVIRLLKQEYPKSKVDFVIKKEFVELLKYHPNISQLYIFDKAKKSETLKNIKQKIKKENYDLIIDLHKNMRSYYLTIGSRAKQIIRYKKGVIRRFFLVKLKLNFYRNIIPIYLRYLHCLAPYQIFYDNQGLEIFFNKEIKQKVFQKYSRFLAGRRSLTIGIAPGARHATKQWTVEGFSTVINYLIDEKQSKVIIMGGPADRDVSQSLNMQNNQSVLETTGRSTILETAVLINCCDLLITNDSGLMHLASALKKKVVAIFGSTTEALGFFPYPTEHIVVQNSSLKCRPCSHIGRKRCPEGHFKCMKEITPKQVISAVEELLISA